MKFQDSSFNGLKVTVGTKSVTHPRTHAPKAICPINFFKVGGIIKLQHCGNMIFECYVKDFSCDIENRTLNHFSLEEKMVSASDVGTDLCRIRKNAHRNI